MAPKDYNAWHAKKTSINSTRGNAYFYEREVWWVAIGHNVGDEEDGKGYNFARPVLIMRKFNTRLFYGLPLSTTSKRSRYYHELTVKREKRVALLSHLRDYDAKRLVNKLGVISESEYLRVKVALIKLLK